MIRETVVSPKVEEDGGPMHIIIYAECVDDTGWGRLGQKARIVASSLKEAVAQIPGGWAVTAVGFTTAVCGLETDLEGPVCRVEEE